MPVIVIQPCAKDTDIRDASPDTNYGTATVLTIGRSSSITHRAIIEFDISNIPAAARITSATLSLRGESHSTPPTVWAYKLTRDDWVENQATWNDYKTDTAWTTAGGDYVTESPSGASSETSGLAWNDWDVTDIVQDACDNSKAAAFLLRAAAETAANAYVRVRSKEAADTSLRPKLTIEYEDGLAAEALAATNITASAARINGKVIGDFDTDCEARFRWARTPELTFQTFTENGTFTVPAGVTHVDVLVVAGGGGGGGIHDMFSNGGGGGGAGGVRHLEEVSVTPSDEINVIVGVGGDGSVGGAAASNGSNSSFGDVTATGGGKGGSFDGDNIHYPSSGGSGGGAHAWGSDVSGAAGTVGQGHDGGSTTVQSNRGGGGGGGAGGVGGTNADNTAGNGGVGVDYSAIFGTSVGASGWFGGGGGGGRNGGTAGSGGTGGGGAGNSSGDGSNGVANTGGGGGAGGGSGATSGGSGGSGIVIVKYYQYAWTETSWAGTLVTNDEFYEDLSGLDSGTEYEYQAQVRYDDEGYVESPWSNVIEFTTLAEPPPAEHCAWCMALFDVSVTVQEVTLKDVAAGLWPILWQDVSTGITASAIPKGWWTEIRDPDGNILCIPRWPQIELELLSNEPHRLTLTIPGDSPCAEYIVKGNELWLRKQGALVDKFLFTHRQDTRNDSGMWVTARTLQLMDQLADELVTGTYSATDLSVTTILTALLAYQRRTPAISLVEVSPALNVNRTLDCKWMTILQAIQRVRDTVGGYLYVDTDRGLHLVESLGSDTGQQVRYKKNLKGIEASTDYVPLCTELYAFGSGEGATQINLEDAIVTDEGATQSEDATHGYLTLGGEFSAYEGFTGDGDALPAHITVWEYPGPANVTADWLQHTDHSVKAALVNYDNTKTYSLNYNHAAYLQNAAAIAAHGVIAKVVANKEISEADSLIAWARVLFRQVSVPMATYEIDMVNLEQRLSFEQLALGNTVKVIDENLGIEVDADVVRMYWSDYMRLEDMEITLSNRARDIADYFSSLQGTEHAFNFYEQT